MVFGENQPQYQPLPVHKTESGRVTSCWTFTWWERVRVLLGGHVYFQQLTFGESLQPIKASLKFEEEEQS